MRWDRYRAAGIHNVLSADPGAGSSVSLTALGATYGQDFDTPALIGTSSTLPTGWECRADVFAFGCVLYEMLSGQRTFSKATPVDTIASIVMEDPPPLPESRRVPSSVKRILERCLHKDPAARFQSAVDLAFALTSTREDLAAQAPAPRRSSRALYAAALVALIGSAALSSWLWMHTPAGAPALAIDALSVVPPSAKPISPALLQMASGSLISASLRASRSCRCRR